MAYTPRQDSYRKSDKPRLSKEEYIAMKNAERDTVKSIVEQGYDDILSSVEGLQKYLDVQSNFFSYSYENAILIAQQMPTATQVKSYEDWGKENVKVKRNNHSFFIREPIPYTDKNGNERTKFEVKRVFDISQTTAKPMKKASLPSIKELTTALMSSSMVECKYAEQLPIENSSAYYNAKDNVIYMTKGNPLKLLQDLARETALAEIAYNDNEYNREASIPSANCAAYMLCKKYGIDTKGIPFAEALDAWKGQDKKDIGIMLAMARDSNKSINKSLYSSLNRDSKEQEQAR